MRGGGTMQNTKLIALAGNPNSGKTTLYNLLTKSGEATGNRAGVTFEPKRAKLRYGGYHSDIVDLPGTYSLSPLGGEERTAADFLREANPDVIIDVCDATNIGRGLFLASELSELFPNVILAINMIDEARREGISIDVPRLSARLGIPVVGISAAKGEGINELIRTATDIGSAAKQSYGFKDGKARYSHCALIASECVKETKRGKSFSDKADRIICKSAFGIPLFFIIIFFIFTLTFSGPVKYLSELLISLMKQLSAYSCEWLASAGFGKALCGFFSDGILGGVGAVMSFLPQTAVLFLLLELLEDTGYMARAAYVTDSILRSAGLSGKAFIPFLLGFGCTVPAVMSTATLDPAERRSVIFSLPFIPCSARFPVFAMIIGAFFPEHPALYAFFIYFLGVVFAYISALLFSKSKSGRSAPPLAIELPKFRTPQAKNLFRAMKVKVSAFALRAGSVVMLCSAALYFLCSFDTGFRYTSVPSESLMSAAGGIVAPLMRPLGLGDWRICSALISGIFAKETIVSSMNILCGSGIDTVISDASAASLIVFSLLYSPCAATLGTIKKETDIGTAILVFIRCVAFAYAASFVTYTVFRFFA